MIGQPFHYSVRMFRLPGWVTPLLVLLALAMIPVAFALALGLMVLALGAGLVRALLPGPGAADRSGPVSRIGEGRPDGRAIDVEFEVKDSDEKS